MERMVRELKEGNSILEAQDFEKYSVVERDVTVTKFKGCLVHGVSAPAGGAVVGQILNTLDGEFRLYVIDHTKHCI